MRSGALRQQFCRFRREQGGNISCLPLDCHTEFRRVVARVRFKFFCEGAYSHCEIVALDCGVSQPLHRISTIRYGFSNLLNRIVKCLLGLHRLLS